MGGSPTRVTLRRWYIRMYFSKEKTGLPDALPAELRSLALRFLDANQSQVICHTLSDRNEAPVSLLEK